VSETRVNEIKKFGAEVIRVKGDYEDSLKECQKLSKKIIGKLFKMYQQEIISTYLNLLWQDIQS
jgi:threonine dehydratase